MSKASRLLSVLLLLIACAAGAATFSASYATATEANGADGDVNIKLSTVPGFSWWSSIVPIIGGDPKMQECWRSLLGTESCVTSAFQSILAGRFALISSECCAAVAALGDNCVPKMFSFLPSGDLIPGLIRSVCATAAPPAAPAGPPSSLARGIFF